MHGASAVESPLSTLKVAREEVGHRLPTADWMVILRRAFGSAGPPDVSDLDLKHFAKRLRNPSFHPRSSLTSLSILTTTKCMKCDRKDDFYWFR